MERNADFVRAASLSQLKFQKLALLFSIFCFLFVESFRLILSTAERTLIRVHHAHDGIMNSLRNAVT